jgi:carboxyl-terminal processing protease
LFDQAWAFARDLFLNERPAAFWESWRRRPGALRDEEDALMKIAEMLAALEETYTRLRTPEETLERYFARRPDSAELKAGSTPEANRSVIARRLGENLAYLRLADFRSPDIASIVRQILEEFGDSPGLVLDLRGNPGGLKDEARKVAEMLVPPDTLLEIERSRSGDARVRAGPRAGVFPDRPLVVLVDGETGSAAESLAQILQSSGRATVLGDRTRGKGVGQAVCLLPGGYSLLVTASQSIDAAGSPLHGRGVVGRPPPERPDSSDPALDEARELLKSPP